MELISISDFVLQHKNLVNKSSVFDFATLVVNYAEFLKQPLKLSMFVPCDDDGNPINEPKRWEDYLQAPESFDGNKEWYELYQYELAKGKILFEGFNIFQDLYYQTKREFIYFNDNVTQLWRRQTYHNGDVKVSFLPNNHYNFSCIEDIIDMNLTLTESAIKQCKLS